MAIWGLIKQRITWPQHIKNEDSQKLFFKAKIRLRKPIIPPLILKIIKFLYLCIGNGHFWYFCKYYIRSVLVMHARWCAHVLCVWGCVVSFRQYCLMWADQANTSQLTTIQWKPNSALTKCKRKKYRKNVQKLVKKTFKIHQKGCNADEVTLMRYTVGLITENPKKNIISMFCCYQALCNANISLQRLEKKI